MELTKLPDHYCPHMEEHLYGYMIENFLPDNLYVTLLNFAKQMYNTTSTKSFFKHNTIFHFNGQKLKLLQNAPVKREIYLIYDIPTSKNYYYQTVDTVRDYSFDIIRKHAPPAFVKVTEMMSELDIFEEDKSNYVPIRCFFNWATYERGLALHLDGDMHIFNTYDNHSARLYSFTTYLNDISYGGQFFTTTGFVYRPKANSALFINGTKIYHGINQNKDKDKTPRLAFTIRWVHKDDLLLPGSPDKLLYDVSGYEQAY